jgi:hypothetical protein
MVLATKADGATLQAAEQYNDRRQRQEIDPLRVAQAAASPRVQER